MMGWIERLPLPWWLFYVLLAVVLIGSTALALWLTGTYARTGFHPMQVWVPFLVAFLLAFIQFTINRNRFLKLLLHNSSSDSNSHLHKMTPSQVNPFDYFLRGIIATHGIHSHSYFAILPSPRLVSSPNLRELAFSTLETLDVKGELSRTVFASFSDSSWTNLQIALAASLPPGKPSRHARRL
jgi:hypothetical protein